MKITKIDKVLICLNILFFIYYAIQLLVFTDEFAVKNIGLFNHAIAGLSEILGIIFFSISLGLIVILFKGINNQLPLFMTILLLQFFISLNFWRYVLTDSPGETNLESIFINALIFSFCFFSTLVFVFNNKKFL
tara:strand:- start:1174 stop:1575 length:402 start_codon:yes stop_codon:yes gene_type:complete